MPDVVAAVRAQAARDDARIDRLFARHNCQYVYLDVGSNNGVQIRKLFEPHKNPSAHVVPVFREIFGVDRCGVCALGIEPNPIHADRLAQVQKQLRSAGFGVTFLSAAASTADTAVSFFQDKYHVGLGASATNTAALDALWGNGSRGGPNPNAAMLHVRGERRAHLASHILHLN